MTEFKSGDWVQVKPEADIPLAKITGPTRGRVETVEGHNVIVHVPEEGCDVDDKSMAVPYLADELVAA